MNFRQIKRELDDLYAGVTHDGKGRDEETQPRRNDEWIIQRAISPEDDTTPWANGEPTEEMMEYVEVIALAVVR